MHYLAKFTPFVAILHHDDALRTTGLFEGHGLTGTRGVDGGFFIDEVFGCFGGGNPDVIAASDVHVNHFAVFFGPFNQAFTIC